MARVGPDGGVLGSGIACGRHSLLTTSTRLKLQRPRLLFRVGKLTSWIFDGALHAGCLEVFPYSSKCWYQVEAIIMKPTRSNWRSWNARKSDAGCGQIQMLALQINVFLTGLASSFHSFCHCIGHCSMTSGLPEHFVSAPLKSLEVGKGPARRKFPSTCLKSCS